MQSKVSIQIPASNQWNGMKKKGYFKKLFVLHLYSCMQTSGGFVAPPQQRVSVADDDL